jgi:hypothetical protein
MQAESVQFKNGIWDLKNAVTLTNPLGKLYADQATFREENHQQEITLIDNCFIKLRDNSQIICDQAILQPAKDRCFFTASKKIFYEELFENHQLRILARRMKGRFQNHELSVIEAKGDLMLKLPPQFLLLCDYMHYQKKTQDVLAWTSNKHPCQIYYADNHVKAERICCNWSSKNAVLYHAEGVQTTQGTKIHYRANQVAITPNAITLKNQAGIWDNRCSLNGKNLQIYYRGLPNSSSDYVIDVPFGGYIEANHQNDSLNLYCDGAMRLNYYPKKILIRSIGAKQLSCRLKNFEINGDYFEISLSANGKILEVKAEQNISCLYEDLQQERQFFLRAESMHLQSDQKELLVKGSRKKKANVRISNSLHQLFFNEALIKFTDYNYQINTFGNVTFCEGVDFE